MLDRVVARGPVGEAFGNDNSPPIGAACIFITRLAKESDISRSMIYEEIAAGRLIARKVGRRTVVRRSDALLWLRSLPVLEATDCNGVQSRPLDRTESNGESTQPVSPPS
jgi:hypothetical protein